MALLKGPKLLNTELLTTKSFFSPGSDNWLLGCLFLFGSSCFWSLWMVLQVNTFPFPFRYLQINVQSDNYIFASISLQVPISASCPDHLYSSAWMCFLASLQSSMIALFKEKDLTSWKLITHLEIASCLYAVSCFLFFYDYFQIVTASKLGHGPFFFLPKRELDWLCLSLSKPG